MTFDWITWGIWFVGLIILVCWCVVPVREFRQLLRARRSGQAPADNEPSNAPAP